MMRISGNGSYDENTENTGKEGQSGFLIPWLLWIVNPLALVWMLKVN